ncbi:MAG: LapA family protein [Pseudomonadota bacterium]
MQIVRTLLIILVVAAMAIFSSFNWQPIEVNLWEDIVWETKMPMLVIVAFIGGLLPMWLYHRSVTWSLGRRMRSLENSIKSNAIARRPEPSTPAPQPTPAASTTAGQDAAPKTVSDVAKSEDSISSLAKGGSDLNP